MKITSIQSGYGMNYNENNSNLTKHNLVEKLVIPKEESIENIKLSKEESKNLYYGYKVNNLMKSMIEIYMDIEKKELEYEDIRDIRKFQNRNELAEFYKEESKIQKNNTQYEVWA